MDKIFTNVSSFSPIYKHVELPIYQTYEFDFFRCVPFDDTFYGRTISELHAGNLRLNNHNGRYSKLFPNEKISYWADSKRTALAEIKKHGSNNNYLTFWSYDDASSSFPTIESKEPIIIIDGIELGFHNILKKIEKNIELNEKEVELIRKVRNQKPDCLIYESEAIDNGKNYLFFEKGFKKLSLREVFLYLGSRRGRNRRTVECSVTCDYAPIIKEYGYYFSPIAKLTYDDNYINTDEYISRTKWEKYWIDEYSRGRKHG